MRVRNNERKPLDYYALNIAQLIYTGAQTKLPDTNIEMKGNDIVVTFPSGKRITLKVSES